jgi:coiled-coil domain-containing protein 39
LQKKIEDIKSERLTLETAITELMVENEMAGNEVEQVKKNKEKVLVQHDCKKLEIKKLRDTVNLEADQVYGLENRKYQLEMSMEEREKEIQVHKDILVSESKAAEEERHKVAVELMYRKTRVRNLRIKYEGLTQRNKQSSGEEGAGDHSQAYFVIKAAQEKEELQRYGDELDQKLRKCEKEIKALSNTLDHLKMRNKNYRDKFIQGAEGADLEKKQILEDQCRAASETLFKKRRELQKLQRDYDDDARQLMEYRGQSQQLKRQNEATQLEGERFLNDISK